MHSKQHKQDGPGSAEVAVLALFGAAVVLVTPALIAAVFIGKILGILPDDPRLPARTQADDPDAARQGHVT